MAAVKSQKILIALSVLAVVIALIALIIVLPNITTKNTIIKTQETELAPYQETVTEQVPLKYIVTDATNITRDYNYTTYVTANIWVKSIDSETGEFSVVAEAKISDKIRSQKQSYVISPGMTKRFNFEFQVGKDKFQEYSYKVVPASKTVTQTITKYKQIVKTTENSS